jgi:hypothetical protein
MEKLKGFKLTDDIERQSEQWRKAQKEFSLNE